VLCQRALQAMITVMMMMMMMMMIVVVGMVVVVMHAEMMLMMFIHPSIHPFIHFWSTGTQRYNGMAPMAKIAFFDIENEADGSLAPPLPPSPSCVVMCDV